MALTDRTRIYIVDDSLTIRAMMETLISRDEDLEICGMAADAESAIEDIDRLMPDVLLLDLALPGMGGLPLLDLARARWPDMKTVVVSSYTKKESSTAAEAVRRGAAACFDKSKLVGKFRTFITLLDDIRNPDFCIISYGSGAVTLPDIRSQAI